MSVADDLTKRLTQAFQPDRLEITNESAKHAGHGGDDGSGESHFHVLIRAQAFADMNRVARHRAVHAALGDLNHRIHALALDLA
ncbi:MAG: BolA family transcriptional regulator [Rhodobacteraceae bacterium]|nr:BolA family transcriptional regulator [Paracoccaceae bacterium]